MTAPPQVLVFLLVTALAAAAVVMTALRGSADWSGSKAARRATLALVLGIFVGASWCRFRETDHLLWNADANVTFMAGIRLHLLPLWNLDASVRDNFFKSALLPVHGLGDSAFYYTVVWFFRVLRIPLTEVNLFSASAALSVVSLALVTLLTRRLFGTGPALVVLVLCGWNPGLIGVASTGFQMTFVIFLQIAVLYCYLLHVLNNRWQWSVVAAGLMALCGGSELFYFAPVLLLLHWAARRSAGPDTTVAWLDPKNMVVWGGYVSLLLVNLGAFLMLPGRADITVFGHLYRKPTLQEGSAPDYGVDTFFAGLNETVPLVLGGTGLIVGLSLALILCSALRRRSFELFAAITCLLVAALTYLMHLTHPFNLMHMLVPVFAVLGIATTHAVHFALTRWRWTAHASRTTGGLIGALLLVPLVGPWTGKITSLNEIPPAYRCMKAVGYAVRELGPPQARVMILSSHGYIPQSMEYYLGRSASGSTFLYYMVNHSDRYFPAALAERTGGPFEFYVDFVNESFPNKTEVLPDLASLNVHEVAQVYEGEAVCARVYSPRQQRMRKLTIEEGNAGFDRTYAQWNRLFSDHHVGLAYYFGPNF